VGFKKRFFKSLLRLAETFSLGGGLKAITITGIARDRTTFLLLPLGNLRIL
jgi:hypothetical protein